MAMCAAAASLLLQVALVLAAGGPAQPARGGATAERARIDPEHLAAPWVAPPDVRFPYQGLHNSLRKLLHVQVERRRVSVTLFTQAQQGMMLNCVYSLVKYGRVRNYIVVTVDAASLERCIALRLPCYNATHLLGNFASAQDFVFGSAQYRKIVHAKPAVVYEVRNLSSGQDFVFGSGQDFVFGSAQYRKIVHAKPAVVYEIYRLGLTVHFTDVDVSYVRSVWPSYEQFMGGLGADVAMMNEDSHVNTGNFVLKYNERVLRLMQAWASDPPERDTYLTDQEWLWSLRDKVFRVCASAAECASAQAAGLAALALHPSQFGKVSWTGHCPGRRPWRACAPYTLYLHVICYSGTEGKAYWMKHYGLWHLGADDFTPVPGLHEYLPCAEEVAWRPANQYSGSESAKLFPKVVFDANDDEDVKHLKPPR